MFHVELFGIAMQGNLGFWGLLLERVWAVFQNAP